MIKFSQKFDPVEISKVYYDCASDLDYVNCYQLSRTFEFWLIILKFCCHRNIKIQPKELNIVSSLFETKSKKNLNTITQNKLKYLIINIISKYSILPYAVMPNGCRSTIDQYLRLLLKYKLLNLNLKTNLSLKNLFFRKLENIKNKKFSQELEIVIPEEFFFSSRNLKTPTILYGTPYAFISSDYIKLLYNTKRVFINAIQHGGGFGEYKEYIIESFERKISDKYYNWGLGDNNIKPNTFSHKSSNFGEITNFYYLGTISYNQPIISLTKGRKCIYKQAFYKRKKIIKEIYNKVNIKYVKHYKDKSTFYHESTYMDKIDTKVLSNSVFIIDVPGHTFFYKAIFQDIPFILFFNRAWIQYFTNNYNEFLNYLKSYDILYYWDEEVDFINQINKISNSKKHILNSNKILKNYLFQ